MYSVKEIFYTLQGEGAQSGRAAVFLRFAGCNLWTGREQDRRPRSAASAIPISSARTAPAAANLPMRRVLADAVARTWPGPARIAPERPYVVCTGGEPLLQLDAPLIEALHARGFEIAIETNGTLAAPPGIDWICVSPKGRARSSSAPATS